MSETQSIIEKVTAHFPDARVVDEPCLCFICKRQARGFAYQNPVRHDIEKRLACSVQCLDDLERVGDMSDLNHFEETAMRAAGVKGGQFLDSLKKYDLSVLSVSEYNQFIQVVFDGYRAEMHRMISQASAPPI